MLCGVVFWHGYTSRCAFALSPFPIPPDNDLILQFKRYHASENDSFASSIIEIENRIALLIPHYCFFWVPVSPEAITCPVEEYEISSLILQGCIWLSPAFEEIRLSLTHPLRRLGW